MAIPPHKWKRCIARRATYAASTTEAAMLYQIMRGLTALHLVRGNLATGYDLSLQLMEIAENQVRRPIESMR